VEEAVNALASAHSAAGLVSPVTTFVKATLEGLQRKLAKPVHKKAPVTVEMLGRMVEDAKLSCSLSDLRLTTACLLAFAGFMRFDEVIQIRPCDLVLQEEFMVIHLPFSKTDQWRKGDEIYITRTGKPTCPVGMLEAYMCRTATSCTDERFLFRPICRSKSGESLRESGSISDSCLRDLFKKKLKKLGYSHQDFSLHSFRAGGATKAANSGIPDHLFKRHGQLKSENAKDGYVEDSIENWLSVTRQLGL